MQHLLPWILASLSVALLAGAGVLFLLRKRKRKALALPTDWALTARPVFSSSERRLYRLLREALPQQTILSKLPLVRFCQPTDPKTVRYWFSLLGASHVSFAVCSSNGRVLAVIDIESERPASRRSSTIKQSVLTACRVRYLSCRPDRLPSVPELQTAGADDRTGGCERGGGAGRQRWPARTQNAVAGTRASSRTASSAWTAAATSCPAAASARCALARARALCRRCPTTSAASSSTRRFRHCAIEAARLTRALGAVAAWAIIGA